MLSADELFEAFLMVYPSGRRQRSFMVTQLFVAALQKVSFEVLAAAVEQQKRSVQWQNPRMIPLMKTWLEEERWIQVLPEVGAAIQVPIARVPLPYQAEICQKCRDRGWVDVVKDDKEICVPCDCRSTNENYKQMTVASRKGHEVKQ